MASMADSHKVIRVAVGGCRESSRDLCRRVASPQRAGPVPRNSEPTGRFFLVSQAETRIAATIGLEPVGFEQKLNHHQRNGKR
jgi:hypothetical protein